jgi:hypothetical protein
VQNRFHHWIYALLFAANSSGVAISAFAANDDSKIKSPGCLEMLSTNGSFIINPLQAFSENLPALASRIGPVYANERFDVRILSRLFSWNTFSPLKLKERTISEIDELQAAYSDFGFKFPSYLQVLVEAHPHAIGQQLQSGSMFQFVWHNEKMELPWFGNTDENIGIPNVFGVRRLFVGRTDKMGFEGSPKILVLPAISSTYHSLQNRFVVSHELAHASENVKSHHDWMWREARTDFLAYLTTGETDLVFSEGIELTMVKSDGSIYRQTVTRVRSLSEPTIASVSEIMPHLTSYHHNSQLISSALFELSQKLGKQKMTEFIHWMDKIEGVNAIPELVAKPKDSQDLVSTSEIEYVDSENLPALRGAIVNHLMRIGALFRAWANQDADDTARANIETVLSARQI